MADIFRIVELNVNTQRNAVVNDENFDRRGGGRIEIWRGTLILFKVDLQLDDGTAFAPDVSSVWNFNIDSVFTPGHEDLVASDDSQFNIPGDRGDLDVAAGKISFRVDTTSTQLEDDLGSAEFKDMFGELWMTPPAQSPVLLTQLGIRVRNIATDIAATSTLVFTTTNIIQFDGDDVVILFPDGSVAERFTKT